MFEMIETKATPLSILYIYKRIMGFIIDKKLAIGIAIEKQKGVYTFQFLNKNGKKIMSILFLSGLSDLKNSKEYVGGVSVLPLHYKSQIELQKACSLAFNRIEHSL